MAASCAAELITRKQTSSAALICKSKDAVARHDHKAYQEAKVLHFKIRVGQQKQKKAK